MMRFLFWGLAIDANTLQLESLILNVGMCVNVIKVSIKSALRYSCIDCMHS